MTLRAWLLMLLEDRKVLTTILSIVGFRTAFGSWMEVCFFPFASFPSLRDLVGV